MSRVNIIEVTEKPSVLEVLPIVLQIEQETGNYVLYDGPLGSFIDDYILLINEVPTQRKMLIVGDFNIDQILPEHFVKVDPLFQNFNLS